jgi:L-threonylcarbamoyladenylate synthase
MLPLFPIHKAARILRDGGVVAYPTEGVYGLGCLPERVDAVAEILLLKKRKPDMGLLLIGATTEQLDPWISMPLDVSLPDPSLLTPVSWVVPAAADAPYWLSGGRDTVAVRLTAFPVAAALCEAAGSALISTSANVSGRPPARNTYVLHRQFSGLVDYIVPGSCGSAKGPSEIRELLSGKTLRPATT